MVVCVAASNTFDRWQHLIGVICTGRHIILLHDELLTCEQLQAKLTRVQKLATNGEATSDSRDSFHDNGTGSDAEASAEKSQQVGPTSHMSLLDQHSKLKLEALGSWLVCCEIAFCFVGGVFCQ